MVDNLVCSHLKKKKKTSYGDKYITIAYYFIGPMSEGV